MKVFVSIPMNGRSIEDVKHDQNHYLEELTHDFKIDGTLGEDDTFRMTQRKSEMTILKLLCLLVLTLTTPIQLNI